MRELAAIANEATEARLGFVIIGGLAVNSYGHARTTFDADFLIPRRDLGAWKSLLERFGYALRHEQETFVQFTPPLKGMWPIDLMLVNDRTFGKLAGEARLLQIAGRPMPVPAPLHLIALKLHALKHGPVTRKDTDLPDIVELVRLQGIDVESAAFANICEAYGTKELRHEIQKRLES